jgi:hypothetical protein
MAAHESPRTTKLYDRTRDEITLDEVERISIWKETPLKLTAWIAFAEKLRHYAKSSRKNVSSIKMALMLTRRNFHVVVLSLGAGLSGTADGQQSDMVTV